MHVKRIYNDPRARLKPCLRCGRSLLANLDDRHCPQCGLSVWLSLNPNDSLDWSRASWLRKSARGAWLLAVAQPIALVAYLLGVITLIRSEWIDLLRITSAVAADPDAVNDAYIVETTVTPATTAAVQAAHATTSPAYTPYEMLQGGTIDGTTAALAGVAMLLAAVHFGLVAFGVFQLTADEMRYPDRVGTVRTVSQVCGGIAAGLGALLLLLAVPTFLVRSPGVWLLAWFLILGTEIVFAACAGCAWWWLRRIAERAGRSGLRRLCGYLLFLPVIPFLKVAPFLGLWILFLASPLLYVLPILYLPVATFLLMRFAKLMQSTAAEADANWASETRAVAVPPPLPL